MPPAALNLFPRLRIKLAQVAPVKFRRRCITDSRGRRQFDRVERNSPLGKETAAVTVVAFRAESYSSDGKDLIISLRTGTPLLNGNMGCLLIV